MKIFTETMAGREKESEKESCKESCKERIIGQVFAREIMTEIYFFYYSKNILMLVTHYRFCSS